MLIVYRDKNGIVTERVSSNVMFLDGLAYVDCKTIPITSIIEIAEG